MRIAFVNSLYPPHGAGGAEVTLRFLAASFAMRGHDCHVFTLTPERTAASGTIDGIGVTYLPLANVYWPHGGARPRALRPVFQALDSYNPVMRRRLQHALAAWRPDVVHAHNLQGFSVSAWVAARRLGVPLVQTLHDYYVACPRSAMWRPGRGNCATPCAECRAFATPRRALGQLPAEVTCVSRRVMQRVAGAGVFRARTARIIRGNNPEVSPASPPPRPPSGPLRLGFIGRLDPLKGVETLLRVVAALPAGTVTLDVAGRGEPGYEASLQAGLPPGVRFLGQVAPAAFFSRIDLLVVPSVWEDPFPRVFHEALAYGVPSLVSPLGGLPEAVEPGRTGFVAASADEAGILAAIQALLAEGWTPEAMREACLAAAARYAPGRIVDQYEAVLLAASRREPPPPDSGETWQAGPADGALPEAAAPFPGPAVSRFEKARALPWTRQA